MLITLGEAKKDSGVSSMSNNRTASLTKTPNQNNALATMGRLETIFAKATATEFLPGSVSQLSAGQFPFAMVSVGSIASSENPCVWNIYPSTF